MRKTLTELVVTRTKAPTEGRLEIQDAITPGFGLRISAGGTRTYFVVYRVKGSRQQHRLTLGTTDQKTLAEARGEAQAALAAAQAGINPKLRKAAAVEANIAEDRQLVQDQFKTVAHLFIERHAKPNLRTARSVELIVERELIAAWGERPIQTITRRDIIALVDKIGHRAPAMANRVQSIVSRLFSWSIQRGILEANPASGLERQFIKRSRSRVLAEDEISAVWLAADAIGFPGGALTKLLMLSACRLREVSRLTKAQVTGDIITLPQTKNGRAFIVPITKQIAAVLAAMPEFNGEFLLSCTAGTKAMGNFEAIKKRLDSASGVVGWTFHDLRRTCATGLAELKVMPHVIEATLNHASGAVSGIAAVYNRYSYADEKRAALEKWGAEVARIVRGGPRLKVVRA